MPELTCPAGSPPSSLFGPASIHTSIFSTPISHILPISVASRLPSAFTDLSAPCLVALGLLPVLTYTSLHYYTALQNHKKGVTSLGAFMSLSQGALASSKDRMKALEGEVAKLRAEVGRLERDLTAKDAEVQESRSIVEVLKSQRNEALKERDESRKELTDLKTRIQPFLHILRISNPSATPTEPPSITSASEPPPPPSTTTTAVSFPKPHDEPTESSVTSFLSSLNSQITLLSASLAEEGVRIVREVEGALEEADEWVDAMIAEEEKEKKRREEEAKSKAEQAERQKKRKEKEDRDRRAKERTKTSPSRTQVDSTLQDSPSPKSRRKSTSPPQHTSGSNNGNGNGNGNGTTHPPRPLFFPDRRLSDSPASLHEVELPPPTAPPSIPLPPLPPSASPLLRPTPLSGPSPPTRSPSRSPSSPPTALSSTSSPGRPTRPLPQQPGAPPQQPQQQTRPPAYMYPYPYSNQQQPMGIPVSLPSTYLQRSSSTSTSGSVGGLGGGAGGIPFPMRISPSSSQGSSSGAKGWVEVQRAPETGELEEEDEELKGLGPYDRQVVLNRRRRLREESAGEDSGSGSERGKKIFDSPTSILPSLPPLSSSSHAAPGNKKRGGRPLSRKETEERLMQQREEASDAAAQAGEVVGGVLVRMLEGEGVALQYRDGEEGGDGKKKWRKRGSSGEETVTGSSSSGGSSSSKKGQRKEDKAGGTEENSQSGQREKKVGEDVSEKENEEKALQTLFTLSFQTALCAYTHWMICSWFFEDERGGLGGAATSPTAASFPGGYEGGDQEEGDMGSAREREGGAREGDGGGAGGHGEGEGLEGLLGEVYARVREGEEQLVSGLWRSLTRKHVQRMLPGAQSATSSKRNSGDDTAPSSSLDNIGNDDGDDNEDPLIDELCVYIVDALVNVLIAAGAHGGWYVSGLLSSYASSSSASSQRPSIDETTNDNDNSTSSLQTAESPSATGGAPRSHTAFDLGLGFRLDDDDAADYSVYRDPYEGYTISQLSEFLAVTPTANSFKMGGSTTTTSTANPPHSAPPSMTRSEKEPSADAPLRRKTINPTLSRAQARSASTARYTHAYLHAHLTALFAVPLKRVLKRARKLNKVMGEEVVRCDLEALYVAPGVHWEGGMMRRVKIQPLAQHNSARDVERGNEKGDQMGGEEDGEGEEGDETPRPGGSPTTKRTQAPATQVSRAKAEGMGLALGVSFPGLPAQQKISPEEPVDPSSDRGGEGDENEQEETEDLEDEEILCTTALGLVRAEKVPMTRGEWDEVVLLKPRVVLVRDFAGGSS